MLMFTLCVAGLPATATPAAESVPDEAWQQVGNAQPGEEVRVTLANGGVLSGRFVSLTELTIKLRDIRTGMHGVTLPAGISAQGDVELLRESLAAIALVRSPRAAKGPSIYKGTLKVFGIVAAVAGAAVLLWVSLCGQCRPGG